MTARARSPQNLSRVRFTPSLEVDKFISTDGASIWPCKLPSYHKQLKNYISTATKDVVFYVSTDEVYAIHVPTNRQELVASLRFKPTCIASGYGWVCLGGFDHGRCAFIDMRKCPPFETSPQSWSAEVDELLPLDLDPQSRLLSNNSTPHDETGTQRQRPKVILEEIGSMIVNGITISKFIHNRDDLPDETVAILSNNDKTVTIYSLTQQATIKTINFTKEINHASTSPDGELLVAVGDVNKVWFYRRSIRKYASKQRTYDWDEIAVVKLISTVQNDWCFSTAWSPSGHICIVASQFGVITVFETSKIKPDMDNTDAIIHSIKSSRPCITDPQVFIPSAPRSMAFSPEPWDLVAWAEDHGRITIADLRDGFISRQTVEVDVASDNLKRVSYSTTPAARDIERERETDFIRRHREALESNDPEAAVQHAAEYIEDAAARRRILSTVVYGGGQELPQSVLSETERELIQMVRVQQERGAAAIAASARPYSINYSDRVASSSIPQSAAQPLTFGQYMLNRTDTRHSPTSWSTPRRRGSVVMSQNSSERAARTSSAHPSSLTPGLAVPLSTSPSRLSEAGNENDIQDQEMSSQPMALDETTPAPIPPLSNTSRATLNELLRTSDTRSNDRERAVDTMLRWRSSSLSEEHQRAFEPNAPAIMLLREQARTWGRRIHELRERAGQLNENFGGSGSDDMTFIDDVTSDIVLGRETISRNRAASQRFSNDGEVSIQGIGWSWDGRYLFVGTAEGIMRYHVNIPARMRLPAIRTC